MAFNPFDFFRRNQKVVFAVLTIVCMFVFILSFGAGDFFTVAQNWFSGPRESGAVVASLYGKTVQESQVSRVQNNRQIATEFLFTTLYAQQEKLTQAQPGAETRVPKAALEIFKLSRPAVGTLGDVATGIAGQIIQRESELRQVTSIDQLKAMEEKVQRDLDLLRNAMLFEKVDGKVDGKVIYSTLDTDQRAKFEDLLKYLQYERYRAAPNSNYADLFQGLGAGANRTYFLGGSRTSEGILDFMVWKNQANKLGIHPTDSAVLRLALTYTGMKNVPLNIPDVAKNEAVMEYLRTRAGSGRDRVTVDELMAALRDEIRVELARQAMTGGPVPGTFPDLGLYLTPVTATPPSAAEGYAHFVKETTTINASLLEIPVEAFLKKVKTPGEAYLEEKIEEIKKAKGQVPADEELTKDPKLQEIEKKFVKEFLEPMFEKYKNDEPSPERSRPAFKEPRQAKVQYLHLSGTYPEIQKKAHSERQRIERERLWLEAVALRGLAIGAGLSHGSVAASPFAGIASVETVHSDSIHAGAYEAYKNSPFNSLESWLNTTGSFGPEVIHDTSWMRVGTVGPLMGHLMGETPLQALVGLGASIHVYESGDRAWYLRKATPGVLLVGDPNTAFLGGVLLGMLHKGQGKFPETVSIQTFTETLQAHQVELWVSRIRGDLMVEAYNLVKGLRGKSAKDAEPDLTAFLKKHGIEGALRTTAYAESAYELPRDPAIKDLVRVVERDSSLLRQDPTGRRAGEFAVQGLALRNRGTYDPVRYGPEFAKAYGEIMQAMQWLPPRQAEEEAWMKVLRQPDAVLIWRTVDRDALVPAKLDTLVPGPLVWDKEKETWQQKSEQVKVSEKVKAAWRREAAMYEAEGYAQKLRNWLKDKKQNVNDLLRVLRDPKDPQDDKDPRAENLYEFKELVGVGRLVKRQTPTATDLSYEPGTIPPSVVAQPRPNMIDQLLNGLKAEGDMIVLSDRPMKHWYLVMCQARTEPLFDTFLIAQATSPGFYAAYTVPSQERSYQEELMKRLRLEACKDKGLVSKDGIWTLPEKLRVNFQRSADGGDF